MIGCSFKCSTLEFPCGLQYDAATNACVTNGKSGHLLFYLCPTDDQLYNVSRDTVCRSYYRLM